MSLTAIADALAALCDGFATIEDAGGRPVARAGDDTVAGDTAASHVRFDTDVTADGVRLGVIRVVAATPSTGVAAALEAAVAVVARHLAALREDGESARERALAALLHEPDATAAARLGLDPDARCAVVAFAADEPARLVRALDTYWTAFRQRAVCGVDRGRAYAVLAVGPDVTPERVTESVRRAVGRAAAGTVRAGASPAAPLADVARSRHLADQTLAVVVADPALDAVVGFDDVRHKVLLVELREAAARRPYPVLDAVSRIVEHDAANRTAYLETLRAYLDAFGDVAVASTSVSVHRRTFRYRLTRIAELSGLRLTDPDERLAVHLMLRLADA